MGRMWSANEDLYLWHWSAKGITLGELARDLGRTEGATRTRLYMLREEIRSGDDYIIRLQQKVTELTKLIIELDDMYFDCIAYISGDLRTEDFAAILISKCDEVNDLIRVTEVENNA